MAHYGDEGLVDRLAAALPAGTLDPIALAPIDQFHTRGLAATREIAALAGIRAEDRVLDIGCGLGGPARVIEAECGAAVIGVDLSQPFVAAARYLTQRTGQRAWYLAASALDLPLAAHSVDVVLLQHVAMNIEDRDRLYREIARVLRPGGRFATHDVVTRGGEVAYPVPWATRAAASHLETADGTRRLIEAAGFTIRTVRDETDAGLAWLAETAQSPPPRPNLSLAMGAEFGAMVATHAANVRAGRVGLLMALATTST